MIIGKYSWTIFSLAIIVDPSKVSFQTFVFLTKLLQNKLQDLTHKIPESAGLLTTVARKVQWGPEEVILAVHVGSFFQKELCHLNITLGTRGHKRGLIVLVTCV